MRKYSKETLQKKLASLEHLLHNEKLRLHKSIDNIGWGTGMRCTKCSRSFRRENELLEKIERVKELIEEYN